MDKALMIDFYELTMANGYFLSDKKDDVVYFDVFFRKNPDQGGYSLFVGLEEIINYINELRFSNEDISFLRSKNVFDESFLKYLSTFRFSGDIYSFEEGEIIFPNVPIMTIKANIIEAQLIETFVLQAINHQTLIATKASKIKMAAKNRIVIEMGARRSHGYSAALNGSKAAYIGGIDATSNVLADKLYGVPSGGTMAHSWVQSFESEYDAFMQYALLYPNNATLLVDTYNTLKSGVPNAIKVIKELLKESKIQTYAIRIDSGDLAYLSKKARTMLDDAGLNDCKIVVSNALDETLISTLLTQNAPIDIFGVGERLITAKSDPVFGAVYKIVAKEVNGEIVPIIKVSDNPIKITNPHYKKVYRIYNKDDLAVADLLTVYNETIDSSKSLVLFDPIHTWKTKEMKEYTVIEKQIKIFEKGKQVYQVPSIQDRKEFAKENLSKLWTEIKRQQNPHKYYVDLSQNLWNIKNDMVKEKSHI